MADEHLNPKMRRNPFAYLGWEYVDNSIENITQDIDMQGNGIVNLREPQEDQDVVTKKYVDSKLSPFYTLTKSRPKMVSRLAAFMEVFAAIPEERIQLAMQALQALADKPTPSSDLINS